MTANESGQFRRASFMALGGVALILAVALAGYEVQPRAPRQRPPILPDSGAKAEAEAEAEAEARLKAIADSAVRDSIAASTASTPITTSKASVTRSRITLRDAEAAHARSTRVAAALEELRQRQLLLPVAGITAERLRDSFDHWRSGGTRRHNAIDLLAPRGTPILAADSGTIFKLDRSSLGGISLYAADPHRRFVYYYAHLDAYHPSITEGLTIARGDTLGFVGTTGNAPPNSPHLHFAIYRTDDIERWSSGLPINPLQVFAPALVRGGSR